MKKIVEDLEDAKLIEPTHSYWKEIELLNCHIEKLHRAMILTTSINGNSHQIFLSQQNALSTHAERARGIL